MLIYALGYVPELETLSKGFAFPRINQTERESPLLSLEPLSSSLPSNFPYMLSGSVIVR